jgi:hypothetical protein
MVTTTDWYAWHASYDELMSPQTRRLAVVQDKIREFLDGSPAGPAPIRAVSLAAGQSRDLLPVLIEHPRGAEVRARLVELDHRNVEFAEGAALSAGLAGIDFITGDAGLIDTFAGAVPAQLVLACGLFELLGPAAVGSTIAALAQLCGPQAIVIWTDEPADAVHRALRRQQFDAAGFVPVDVVVDAGFVVGVERWAGAAAEFVPETRLFRLGPS